MTHKTVDYKKELLEANREIEILKWGLSKTNEAIKVLYMDLDRKNKALQRAKEKLASLAAHDSLTRLMNRRSFNKKIEEYIKSHRNSKKISALFFLDLDNFKIINDSHGHLIGDSLLQEISRRLKRIIKKNDLCARYGGDEFAVFFENINENKKAEEIADRLLKSINRPFVIEGINLNVSVSIGIALLTNEVDSYKTLYYMADIAMYKAKEDGKNRYHLYSA